MSKWMIPRHKPKKDPEWARADKNHGKRFVKKRDLRLAREAKSRRNEIGFLDLVTKQGNERKAEIATIRIGQCARKVKLTYDQAYKCCRSAAMEKSCDMYAYKCKWCGSYHLTSHPLPGYEYPIKVKGFKV